jgi:hypothetical protein
MDVKKNVERTVEETEGLLGGKEVKEETEVEIDNPLGKEVVKETTKVKKE